jgi:hypothetical protein
MPYDYEKTGDGKYRVFKKDTGKTVGHTTKAKIKKYLAALHANAPETESHYKNLFEDAPVEAPATADPQVPLGKHNNMKDIEFNPTEYAKGIRFEKEKHGTSEEIAKAIVKDHLVGDPAFYTHLDKMIAWVAKKQTEKK